MALLSSSTAPYEIKNLTSKFKRFQERMAEVSMKKRQTMAIFMNIITVTWEMEAIVW